MTQEARLRISTPLGVNGTEHFSETSRAQLHHVPCATTALVNDLLVRLSVTSTRG